MSVGFIHLSDIHFGQEFGGSVYIHNDIKQCVVKDVSQVVKEFKTGKADGVIVTGDIAFCGQADEYDIAAKWLDQIADAAGCEITDIQVVPGNHDVDRSSLNPAVKHMLAEIIEKGQPALDAYMSSEAVRALLFERFKHYLPFAEAYRCPLDVQAQLAEERVFQLIPGRSIRFVRINSALISYQNKEDGSLLLGESQHVISERQGEEQVLLSHHPLHCFKDKDEAGKYIESRARVFISGHEHIPSCVVDKLKNGRDLMRISAGATIPPRGHIPLAKYCFNLIEFELDETLDGLIIKIYPRVWNDADKRFEAGTEKGYDQYHIDCPNFKASPIPKLEKKVNDENVPATSSTDIIVITASSEDDGQANSMDTEDRYPLLVLRFFRDISYSERKEILLKLGVLPPAFTGNLSEAFVRALVDRLVEQGRSKDIWAALEEKLKDK